MIARALTAEGRILNRTFWRLYVTEGHRRMYLTQAGGTSSDVRDARTFYEPEYSQMVAADSIWNSEMGYEQYQRLGPQE